MTIYPHKIKLSAKSSVEASVVLPGSKSITNRAYLLAALADGETKLVNPLFSDDTVVMTQCLTELGVKIQIGDDGTASISGSTGRFAPQSSLLFTGNSGTTIRFLTAASALASKPAKIVLDGVARMRQRPIIDLIEALQQLGVQTSTASNGCPPVEVFGGGIPGGRTLIKGSISSQYLSALLMAAPYADQDVNILVDGDLVSKPYVDMTLAMMRSFGVEVSSDSYASFSIPGNQLYRSREYVIEPDASNASYFLAAAAVTGGTVTITGLGTSSIQGDITFIDVLQSMGCIIEKSSNSLTVTGPTQLNGITFDASEIPDMAQTIAVTAAFADGPTVLTGLRTLRVKETDRVRALAVELRKIGASVTEGDEHLIIEPAETNSAAEIDTYDDHRMAMSFAVAGLRIQGLTINDPGCVAKTFPDFWVRWDNAFPGAIEQQDNS